MKDIKLVKFIMIYTNNTQFIVNIMQHVNDTKLIEYIMVITDDSALTKYMSRYTKIETDQIHVYFVTIISNNYENQH